MIYIKKAVSACKNTTLDYDQPPSQEQTRERSRDGICLRERNVFHLAKFCKELGEYQSLI